MTQLTEDQIDDILFYARTGESEDLQTYIQELSRATSISEEAILSASVEEQSQNTSLHMAAANGQLGTLNYILLKIISAQSKSSTLLTLLNAQNTWGNTPVHWAALNGHLEAVKALVKAGANLGIRNKAGHDAVYEAQMNSNDKVVEWLLLQDRGVGSRSEELKGSDSPDDEMKEGVRNDETELLVEIREVTLEPSLEAKDIS